MTFPVMTRCGSLAIGVAQVRLGLPESSACGGLAPQLTCKGIQQSVQPQATRSIAPM